MSKDTWILGKWRVVCDRCGFERNNDMVAKEPRTNLMVCKDTCLEVVHPQEFVRGKPDPQNVPFTSPEPSDVFVSVTYADSSVGDQEPTIPSGTFSSETL